MSPDLRDSLSPESKATKNKRILEENTSISSSDPLRKKMCKSMSLGQPTVVEISEWHSQTQNQVRCPSCASLHLENRLGSSSSVCKADKLGIHCPTPERPTSSQSSRVRFSKIIDVEEDGAVPPSADFAPYSLTRLVDNGSPLEKAPLARNTEQNLEPGETMSQHGRTTSRESHDTISYNTDHEKSTVESLLDHHIKCLGLEPHKPELVELASTELSGLRKSTLSLDRNVRPTRLSDRINHVRWKGHVRSATEIFESYGNLTPEQKALVPQRLFHDNIVRRSITDANSAMRSPNSNMNQEGQRERPSASWMTLPSSPEVMSKDPISENRQDSESNKSCEDVLIAASAYDADPKTDLTPATHNRENPRRTSIEIDTSTATQLQQPTLAQETPPQGRVRLKLKVKTHSRSASHSNSSPTDESADPVADHIPNLRQSAAATSMGSEAGPQRTNFGQMPIELPTAEVQEPSRLTQSLRLPSKKAKPSQDLVHKPSAQTLKSHRSAGRRRHPIPYIHPDSKYPRLAAPDLGPPLTSTSFDLNLQLNTDASLREQKSFFSEDSDRGLRNSLRKRLHGIGNILNVSPKASSDPLLDQEQWNQSSMHARPSKRHGKSDSMQHNGVTIGMSDFAFKKRRLLERLKAWWRRQRSRLRGKRAAKTPKD